MPAKDEGFAITAERGALLPALQLAAKAVPGRSTVPILANVALTTEGEGVRVAGTDMDITVSVSAAATVLRAGRTTAPAGALLHLVGQAENGCQVTLTLEDTRLLVRAGSLSARLPVLPADDWPLQSRPEASATLVLEASALGAALARVAAAISREETRYYLNGVMIENAGPDSGGGVRLVTTDGHRLHALQLACTVEGDLPQVIVPAATVAILRGLEGEELTLQLAPGGIVATCGAVEVLSKTIDGTFPEWQRVVPPAVDDPAFPPVRTLAGTVKRLLFFGDDKSSSVSLRRRDGEIALGASGSNGAAADRLACEGAGAWDVAINGRYFLAALEAAGAETVAMSVTTPTAPVRLDADGGIEAGGATFIVMPMRDIGFPEDLLALD